METIGNCYHIEVAVESSYVVEHSAPENNRFVFAYTITLRNTGTVAAQLRTRHWIITDANARVQEVRGEGVVGKQPALLLEKGSSTRAPRSSRRRSAVCTAATGCSRMTAASSTPRYPRFSLSVPNLVH